MVSARDGLLNEIRLLGGKSIILSTNIPLRNDGLPYARYKMPDDIGVAVYFQLNNQPQVFACDRWKRIEDNMQAIRKTIEALRGIERWGSSEMLNRIYKGFQALPEQGTRTDYQAWWVVLNVNPDSTEEEIKKSYRNLSKTSHPDLGGSHEMMLQLNKAYQEAKQERNFQ